MLTVTQAARRTGKNAETIRRWRIADEMGWAKTYDAEFVALAALLRGRLVTDVRLRAALGFVVRPTEL
jgi:hypothetical protein